MSRVRPVDSSRCLLRLGHCLFPLETPIADLPVDGFLPAHFKRPRAAAVLLGITREPEPQIVLTLRARHLSRHAGQVSFPGGARDLSDGSVIATALRETREETGIPERAVTPIGYLGRYDTITGYRMTAVVALIEAGLEYRIDQAEVEQVFTVSLVDVVDEEKYRCESMRFFGRDLEVL
ncbi:MAG: CoA pyrophosphatase, partial [Wenzhouxiangellaceae bacterium]